MPGKRRKRAPETEPAATLRARAEALLRTTRTQISRMPPENVHALVHELQVHQIELQLQNEELRQAQLELADSRDRFADLYDFAPFGYLELDPAGRIIEANLTAAHLLHLDRSKLAGTGFTRYVGRDDQDRFYLHRTKVLESASTLLCELTLCRPDGSTFAARLESVALANRKQGEPARLRTAIIDITEEKKARVWELQAERLRRMVENLPAGAVYIENDSLHLNRAAEHITGYGRDELRTRNQWFGALYGASEEEARELYEENRAGGFLRHTRTVITRRDGERRVVEFSAHGFDGHEVWFLHDVTDREKAETALRESEERIRGIFDAAVDAIVAIDRSGGIVAVNPAAGRIFGYGEGELLGSNVSVLMPSPDREQHDRYLERYHRTGEAKIIGIGREVVARRKDGSTFPAELSVSEAQSLGIYTGIVRDISKRIDAEQALRREHEFSEKIIDTAQTIIVVLDPEGRIVRFNPYFERLSGWRLEDAVGRSWFATFLLKRDRRAVAALFKKAVEGVRTRGNTNAIVTRGGEERLIEWFDAVLTDAEGNVAGLLCTGTDVTDRRKLEGEVVNAAEEERRRTAQDLHDGVASLLTGIDFRVQKVAKELGGPDAARADEVRMISGLIRDAIVQTRAISRGLHPVGSHPEDLVTALRGLASQVPAASKATCRFHCGAAVVMDDSQHANHLFRIAQEAVNNALKHSDATRLTLSLAQDGRRMTLRILDNGNGFDPGLSRSGGLGLQIMEYRAHAIGGSLTIRRRRKRGTEVMCSLPVRAGGE